MKKRKKGSGGERPGAGRPKVEDPRIHLNVYARKSAVERLGGIESAQQLAQETIEKAI